MGLLYVNIEDVNQGIDVIPSIMEKGGATLNKAVIAKNTAKRSD